MDNGQYTFVINVPANFQADLLAGRQPGLQVNVDATAMSQAFMGAGYIGQIFQRELLNYAGQGDAAAKKPGTDFQPRVVQRQPGRRLVFGRNPDRQ